MSLGERGLMSASFHFTLIEIEVMKLITFVSTVEIIRHIPSSTVPHAGQPSEDEWTRGFGQRATC